MRIARLLCCAVAVSAVGGCGGGDGGGNGPDPDPVFTSVSVTSPSPTVIVGVPEQLTALAKDQNGANMSGATFTFASSDQTKATVTNAGQVTGVAAGTTRITATGTLGGATKTGTLDLTVVAPGPTASVNATAASQFEPRTVAVTPGGTVTWSFAILHNVQFTGAGAPANIPDRGTGSEARQFNTAGTFNYNCGIHPGMSGTVVVR